MSGRSVERASCSAAIVGTQGPTHEEDDSGDGRETVLIRGKSICDRSGKLLHGRMITKAGRSAGSHFSHSAKGWFKCQDLVPETQLSCGRS